MALPVLSLNTATPITVVAGTPNDNQMTLVGGQKYAWQFTSSAPVEVNLYGPFPSGVVSSSGKAGLGKMSLSGTTVNTGNTAPLSGNYLVELVSTTLATVDLTVSKWTVWDTIFWQFWWKIVG